MSTVSTSYEERRQELTAYFDSTAANAWTQLTSDAPVSRIRATVRAGRDAMRDLLLSWLPGNLEGRSVLDAGCGPGAFAIEAARRGARVVAVDISPTLIEVARERTPDELAERIEYRVGDMLAVDGDRYDHVVAMDSLIHYGREDFVTAVGRLGAASRRSVLLTFAPRTPLLTAMHVVGRLIPQREHRAPAIVPQGERRLADQLLASRDLSGWAVGRGERVRSGFYTSQALELICG